MSTRQDRVALATGVARGRERAPAVGLATAGIAVVGPNWEPPDAAARRYRGLEDDSCEHRRLPEGAGRIFAAEQLQEAFVTEATLGVGPGLSAPSVGTVLDAALTRRAGLPETVTTRNGA